MLTDSKDSIPEVPLIPLPILKGFSSAFFGTKAGLSGHASIYFQWVSGLGPYLGSYEST